MEKQYNSFQLDLHHIINIYMQHGIYGYKFSNIILRMIYSGTTKSELNSNV